MYKSLVSFLLLFFMMCGCANYLNAQEKKGIQPYNYSINKYKECNKEAAVCAHPLAAQVGLMILQKGGNAVDASIAMQWALAVVYPGAGNIGGGGFMVALLKSNKKIAIDYRETAPQAATKNMYVSKANGKANTSLSQNGHLAAGIPGTPAGLFAAHKYAKLPMKLLIQPAIDLAEKGFVITQSKANGFNESREAFEKNNAMLPVFVYAKAKWKKGDTLIQKDLAATLRLIRDKGQKGFYEGKTAQLLIAEMKRGNGIISLSDLKKYHAKERSVSSFTYKGFTIITMPLPSSGGILLQQMLKMLEPRALPQYGFLSVKSVQLITEVERRSYADRAEYLGDPDFYNVPQSKLLSLAYLNSRMLDYDSTHATKSEDIKAGNITTKESDETTHLSVLDRYGNAVSVTTTLNGHYGSKTVVGKAGFLLNNEMDDFSIQPGVPNMYGAIGGEANAIVPGKRMLSSMTPTIVLKNKAPFMVVGTPGGTTIITSVLQSIIDVVDYKMSAVDAVNNPKFHHQWQPDEIKVEKDFPEDVRKQLETMGYRINIVNAIGRTAMILVKPNGKIDAVGDKRGDDSVAGE